MAGRVIYAPGARVRSCVSDPCVGIIGPDGEIIYLPPGESITIPEGGETNAYVDSFSITSFQNGVLSYSLKMKDLVNSSMSLRQFGVRSTIQDASYVSYASFSTELFSGVTGSVTVNSNISGISYMQIGEPLKFFFVFTLDGNAVLQTMTYTPPLPSEDIGSEYMTPYRPSFLYQNAFYENVFVGGVDSCMTNAVLACKEIQELRQGKSHTRLSHAWFFGAIGGSTNPADALRVITEQGAPPYEVVDCSQYGVYDYPDVLLVEDAVSVYQNAGDLSSWSLPQKCASAVRIEPEDVDYAGICDAIKNTGRGENNSRSAIIIVNTDAAMDEIGIGDSNLVGPLTGRNRGLHAMVLLGWRTVGGHRYWVCQNSWCDVNKQLFGDDGLYYIPWSWVGVNSQDGVLAFCILEDDPDAPELPALEDPEVPGVVTKRRGPDYLIVTAPEVSGATDYQVSWREPVTGNVFLTNYGDIENWSFGDGYVPDGSDMAIHLLWDEGLYGRTFYVKMRVYKDGEWSLWGEERQVTALPYVPGTPILSRADAQSISVCIPAGYFHSDRMEDPGRFSFVRVWYNTTGEDANGVFSGTSVDFQYPDRVGVISGLETGKTYYFTAVVYLQVNGVTLSSYYRCGTTAFQLTDRPKYFSWMDGLGWPKPEENELSAGDPLPPYLTADGWNVYTQNINDLRAAMGLSGYSFTQAVSGVTVLSAAMVNQAISAVSAMAPPVSVPGNTVSGVTVLSAALLNGLVDSLNSIS